MTGSTTTCGKAQRDSALATASTTSGVASMPVFTAWTAMSEATASIWATTNSGGTANTASTDCVFWAVSAAMALVP